MTSTRVIEWCNAVLVPGGLTNQTLCVIIRVSIFLRKQGKMKQTKKYCEGKQEPVRSHSACKSGKNYPSRIMHETMLHNPQQSPPTSTTTSANGNYHNACSLLDGCEIEMVGSWPAGGWWTSDQVRVHLRQCQLPPTGRLLTGGNENDCVRQWRIQDTISEGRLAARTSPVIASDQPPVMH